MTVRTKFGKKLYRNHVRRMTDKEFQAALQASGSYEDMANILRYFTKHCRKLTPSKLEGLTWFAYAWALTIYNIELGPFEWIMTPYGPAETTINKMFDIDDEDYIPPLQCPRMHRQIEELLDAVIRKYGSLSDTELTHRYSQHLKGWVDIGEVISPREVFLFFAEAVAA